MTDGVPHVEDQEVRVVAHSDPPLEDREQPSGVLRAHAHGLCHRDHIPADHIHHHRHCGLHPGNPPWGRVELLCLLLSGVRSVVRSEHVYVPGQEPSEQPVAAVYVPQRRVDLVFGAREAVDLEHHVVHCDFSRESGRLRHVETFRRRQMAYVDPGSPEVGGQPAYGSPLGLGRTVPEMVPGAALRLPRYEMVVLRVDAHPLARCEDVPDRRDHLLVVVQQYVPGRGSHEELERWDQGGDHAGVDVGGDCREQTVVHVRPAPDGRLLVQKRLDIGDRGLGVGHVEDARHSAVDGGHRPRVESLFVRHTGVAEVHVRIHETRQDYPA